jgi:hypothetical protein
LISAPVQISVIAGLRHMFCSSSIVNSASIFRHYAAICNLAAANSCLTWETSGTERPRVRGGASGWKQAIFLPARKRGNAGFEGSKSMPVVVTHQKMPAGTPSRRTWSGARAFQLTAVCELADRKDSSRQPPAPAADG